MPRIPRPERDLSQQAGNPTSELQKHYSTLMAIQDPEELYRKILEIVEPTVGHGFSDRNYQKFMTNLDASKASGLLKMQRFITNFILAGSGMRVTEDIEGIASLIDEDLTREQKLLAQVVRQYGFHAGLVTESVQEVNQVSVIVDGVEYYFFPDENLWVNPEGETVDPPSFLTTTKPPDTEWGPTH